ncbi:HypC/HybG/HupF family hydrogenase formation chaperone [archaeon]|nr:HypC/HybG/HupF family hydrogenase formation chaperone [archaeon]
MCITTPGRILKIENNKAIVDINGTITEVRIDLVKASVGDYVYCASGMAIEKADR